MRETQGGGKRDALGRGRCCVNAYSVESETRSRGAIDAIGCKKRNGSKHTLKSVCNSRTTYTQLETPQTVPYSHEGSRFDNRACQTPPVRFCSGSSEISREGVARARSEGEKRTSVTPVASGELSAKL